MEDILEKNYISAKELQQVTGFGLNTCRTLIDETQEEMRNKKLYIPATKKNLH